MHKAAWLAVIDSILFKVIMTKVTTPKKAKTKTPQDKAKAKKLCEVALKLLDERKAEDILSVDLEGQSALADYIIIASGGSSRQVAALADYLRRDFLKHGVKPVRIEGLPQADWVLVDAGDVIVHLFRQEVRDYYKLDDRFEQDDEA